MTRTPFLQCAFICLFVLLTTALVAQHQDQSKSAYRQSMISVEKNKYLDDAYRLALRLSTPVGTFREAPQEIPVDIADQIYTGLVAIYESDLPECLAISRDIRIHSKPFPVTDRVSLILQPGESWKAMQAEEQSNALIEFIEAFDLVVEMPFPGGPDQEGIVLLSERPMNMAAIGNQLAEFSEVSSVLNTGKERDGTDIKVAWHPNGLEYTFELTWGACKKECANKHYWSFLVDDQYQVNFLQDGGTPLPEWWTSK